MRRSRLARLRHTDRECFRSREILTIATMNGAAFLGVEVDPPRLRFRLKTRYIDCIEENLDKALERVSRAKEKGDALSVGLLGNAADILPELARRRFPIPRQQ